MSYDLMVFEPSVAPADREAFLAWYREQVRWSEGHNYDDPAVSSPKLAGWFAEMAKNYPPLNGPLAHHGHYENPRLTDYCIGKSVIYAAFRWSEAESAYAEMRRLAEKHQVGFFDVSSEDAEIWLPPG